MAIIGLFPLSLSAQPSEVTITIDGSAKYQTMDGFGVNINPAWWYNGNYTDATVVQPAIDLLVDSLGATIYRAVIEEIDWEEVNDDNDPNHFNWDYYNKVFSNTRFTGVWNTLRYLNRKGITDGLVISFMGAAPAAPPSQNPIRKEAGWGGSIIRSRKQWKTNLSSRRQHFSTICAILKRLNSALFHQ